MTKKSNDALSRSDRALFVALAIVLATASAAVGASLTYRPYTNKMAVHTAKLAPTPVRLIAGGKPGPDAVMTGLLAEHRCLAEALYYEARGEGARGQKAVAEVVFNRMNNGNYGHSICAVVYEGAGHSGCQFTFTCDGELRRTKQAGAWKESEEVAAEILTSQAWRKDSTGGALNYHAASVNPVWADTMSRTTQIGNHIFYRGAPHSRAS